MLHHFLLPLHGESLLEARLQLHIFENVTAIVLIEHVLVLERQNIVSACLQVGQRVVDLDSSHVFGLLHN